MALLTGNVLISKEILVTYHRIPMAKIKILKDDVINKIAAGEVIERPASVVKELIENSLDAGASEVIVEVMDGGKRLIRISDNGTGMSHDDVLLSIERHATSKIENISDIENIVTLGFRGEALPSIVSVSNAVVTTKAKDTNLGTRLIIDGGVIREVTDIGREQGTDIEIKNLFFNLPARRKFLTSNENELLHIKNIVYETIASSPGVSVKLMSDGKESFSYRGCRDKRDMLRYLLGESLAGHMVPVAMTVDRVRVEGFIGKPETARKSAAHQYIVMNGRPVRSKSILRAVYQGYGAVLIKGLVPPFVLYFEAEPSRIDVNVHPTKREIRIHREFIILQALTKMVTETFQNIGSAPDIDRPYEIRTGYSRGGTPVTLYNPPDFKWYKDVPRGASSEDNHEQYGQIQLEYTGEEQHRGMIRESSGEVREPALYEGPQFWHLKDRYIITTIKEGGLIIDQHVAHERILYEDILGQFTGKDAPSQRLLFPATFDFSADDYDVLQPMIPFLNRIGFGIREFGVRSVIIDSIPSWHKEFGDGKILLEFADEMRIHGKITSGYSEKLAAAIACRSAIKAGEPLTQEEMRYLVDRLFATSAPFVCPHGRPTMVRLTLDELDRRFGRRG
jgi:DNA mismatch repair protein MutL